MAVDQPDPPTPHYPTFHHAYVDQLRLVHHRPAYRNAPRGFASRERLAVQFTLRDPTQRVAFIPARRPNIIFNFAEALWYLSGRDDLDFIGYYAPRMRRYSMDGRRLTGTAYGRKIFDAGGGPSQWDAVAGQLSADPDTKRAVLQIFGADELNVPDNIDVSCTLGLQFLLREGRLHAIGYMRANDAYRGMCSDVFSFTLLQEVLAGQLRVPVGEYTHVVGSLHVYAADDSRVEQTLADPAAVADPAFRLPAMPAGDNRGWLGTVLELEEALRTDRHQLTGDLTGDAGRLGLPRYWQQVVLLLEFYRRLRHDGPAAELLPLLDPAYRYLLAVRWPATVTFGQLV